MSAAPALADLDERLQRRGYVPTALTLVEVADAAGVLDRARRGPQLELRVAERPTDEWFDVYWSVARPDRGPEDAARCRRVLLAPPLPTSFVTAMVDGSPAGVGQIVVDRGFAGVQCMATVPGARRRGVAGSVLDRLAALALEHGAPSLYLAVMADNAGARALYERCGFRAVHRYHYLVGQDPSAET